MSKKDKVFFVMMSRSTTRVSRMIRSSCNGCKYTHASLVMDKEMKEIYSYGRKVVNNPLISGFIHEDLDEGIFAMNHKQPCILFKVAVTSEVFDRMWALINDFKEHNKDCKYNFLGLAYLHFKKRLPRKGRKYTCTQYVASMLEDSGAVPHLAVDRWITMPGDLEKNSELVPIFEGKIGDVRKGLLDYYKE